MILPSSLVSGALSVIHPQLYADGMHRIHALESWSAMNNSCMNRALSFWPTTFTNISLIANQSTPLNHYPQSHASWFDMIINVGEYDQCAMAIPTLGVELLYRPRTCILW